MRQDRVTRWRVNIRAPLGPVAVSLLECALLAALVFFGLRTLAAGRALVRDWLDHRSVAPKSGDTWGAALDGVDGAGRVAFPSFPQGARGVCLFVVRYQPDLKFWNAVAARLHGSGILLEGVCAQVVCIDSHFVASADFPLVSYGRQDALQELAEVDESGDAVLVGQRLKIIATPRWRGATPADFAADLKTALGGGK